MRTCSEHGDERGADVPVTHHDELTACSSMISLLHISYVCISRVPVLHAVCTGIWSYRPGGTWYLMFELSITLKYMQYVMYVGQVPGTTVPRILTSWRTFVMMDRIRRMPGKYSAAKIIKHSYIAALAK